MGAALENRLPNDDDQQVAKDNIDLHQYSYLPDSAVYGISGKAFDLIHQYSIPPDPISYTVWFAYASNSNAHLKERVDSQLGNRGGISRQEIALIYRNFLEDNYVTDSQQNLSLELETNLSDITSVMDDSASVYEDYARALGAAKERLSIAESNEALKQITNDILEENQKVADVTSRLQADLDESRTHIQNLNKKLEELHDLSLTDPLTRASNRRAFDTHLKDQIQIAEEEKSHLCIAFVDLDLFKRVNDLLGHQLGDVVLRRFASLLTKWTPHNAIVARYGGEEFALILPGMSKVSAHNLGIKLCYDLPRDRFLAETQHKVLGPLTASIGISSFKPGQDSYQLLEAADKKLYEAKNAGRNCVRVQVKAIGNPRACRETDIVHFESSRFFGRCSMAISQRHMWTKRPLFSGQAMSSGNALARA